MEIKVGYLVAYDYELLKHSLPTVYPDADKIVIAIDKNRRTFAGGFYTINPDFFEWLTIVDVEKKITIYEDEFYKKSLTANEADTRTRILLAKQLGEGGWHVQVDVDEYFIKFNEFVTELQKLTPTLKGRKVDIHIACNVIFKQSERGFFVLDGNPERFCIATNQPKYTLHRNSQENEAVFINHVILHQSWGRTPAELQHKLQNWSHHTDFNTKAYYQFWQSVNETNYQYIRDFHPLFKGRWQKLQFIEGKSIPEVLSEMPHTLNHVPTAWAYRLRNWLPPAIYRKLPTSLQV